MGREKAALLPRPLFFFFFNGILKVWQIPQNRAKAIETQTRHFTNITKNPLNFYHKLHLKTPFEKIILYMVKVERKCSLFYLRCFVHVHGFQKKTLPLYCLRKDEL